MQPVRPRPTKQESLYAFHISLSSSARLQFHRADGTRTFAFSSTHSVVKYRREIRM
jgi:hypothetical protein